MHVLPHQNTQFNITVLLNNITDIVLFVETPRKFITAKLYNRYNRYINDIKDNRYINEK